MSELQKQVQRLIEIFEHMRRRPSMYIPMTKDAFVGFIAGLSIGTDLGGNYIGNAGDKIYQQVLQEHGWNTNVAMNLISQMEEQGYSIEKTIEETLLIYIESLKRHYNIPETTEKQD